MLIFTQMTRMLDVLEQFLTYHGHLYLRLDGSTRVEQRQVTQASPALRGSPQLCLLFPGLRVPGGAPTKPWSVFGDMSPNTIFFSFSSRP